jgi:hypothetical protein
MSQTLGTGELFLTLEVKEGCSSLVLCEFLPGRFGVTLALQKWVMGLSVKWKFLQTGEKTCAISYKLKQLSCDDARIYSIDLPMLTRAVKEKKTK